MDKNRLDKLVDTIREMRSIPEGGMDKKTNLTCPFCGETDFDKVGLKIHIINGWCEEFENTEVPERYRR